MGHHVTRYIKISLSDTAHVNRLFDTLRRNTGLVLTRNRIDLVVLCSCSDKRALRSFLVVTFKCPPDHTYAPTSSLHLFRPVFTKIGTWVDVH